MLEIIELKNYTEVQPLGGGTQSTYKLISHDETLPPLVLKYGASPEAMAIEIVCNAVYHAMGVNIPPSQVFQSIPRELAKKLDVSSDRLVQISEFIHPVTHLNNQRIIDYAKKDFALHALLGNIDVGKTDNFIEGTDGTVYLIDTGSNFIFRALGEARRESASIVGEINSMRNNAITQNSWFTQVADSTIREHVACLLVNEYKIEETIWELSATLGLSDSIRKKFLEGLSDRFDDLAMRYAPQVPRFGKIDKKAQAGNTAAGILSYALHENEPYVLLAKRLDSEYWDCLGGKSGPEEEYLFETAASKVSKGSGKSLSYIPSELKSIQYHDIITEKNGEPFITRLYLKETNFNQEIAINEEYDDFKWLKWDDLINKKEPLNISPEFKLLIERDAVQRMLKPAPIAQKRPMILKKPKEPILRRFHSPTEKEWELTHQLLNHLNVIAELKNRFRTQSQEILTITPPRYTQSELHMKAMLGDEYIDSDAEGNIRRMFGIAKLNYPPGDIRNEKEHLITLLAKLVENERKASPDTVFFYHACPSDIAYVYEIYSALYQLFQADSEKSTFRGNDIYFKPFMNIEAFMSRYTKSSSGDIDNYESGYNKSAISANYALFGNHALDTSCSINLLINNHSGMKLNISELINEILPLGTDPCYHDELMRNYTQTHPDPSDTLHQFGVLYQVSLNSIDADNNTYLAGVLGVTNPYGQVTRLSILRDTLEHDYFSNSQEMRTRAKKYLESVQIRFIARPELKLQTIAITDADIKGVTPRNKLTKNSPIIIQLANEIFLHARDDFLSRKIPVHFIFKSVSEKISLPTSDGRSQIGLMTAIEKKDMDKILRIVNEKPELRDYLILATWGEPQFYRTVSEILVKQPDIWDRKIQKMGLFNKNCLIGKLQQSSRLNLDDYLINILLASPHEAYIFMRIVYGANWPRHLPDDLLVYLVQRACEFGWPFELAQDIIKEFPGILNFPLPSYKSYSYYTYTPAIRSRLFDGNDFLIHKILKSDPDIAYSFVDFMKKCIGEDWEKSINDNIVLTEGQLENILSNLTREKKIEFIRGRLEKSLTPYILWSPEKILKFARFVISDTDFFKFDEYYFTEFMKSLFGSNWVSKLDENFCHVNYSLISTVSALTPDLWFEYFEAHCPHRGIPLHLVMNTEILLEISRALSSDIINKVLLLLSRVAVNAEGDLSLLNVLDHIRNQSIDPWQHAITCEMINDPNVFEIVLRSLPTPKERLDYIDLYFNNPMKLSEFYSDSAPDSSFIRFLSLLPKEQILDFYEWLRPESKYQLDYNLHFYTELLHLLAGNDNDQEILYNNLSDTLVAQLIHDPLMRGYFLVDFESALPERCQKDLIEKIQSLIKPQNSNKL